MADDINEINSTSEPTASDIPDTHDTEDVTGLKNKVAELLGEKKQWQAKHRDLEVQFQAMVGILGTKDPDALRDFKDSVEQERQKRIEAEKAKSEIESQVSGRYQSQIAELNQRMTEKERLITQKLQSDALRSLYSANAGEDYDSFNALLGTKFKVEYEENGVDFNGLPQYKVKSILQRNGDPLFFDGKEAKPEDVLLKARQGEYGQALSATFTPWNQSSGGALPKGIVNGNGVVRYPRSQRSQMLARDFDGSIRRQIANKEIEFYDG